MKKQFSLKDLRENRELNKQDLRKRDFEQKERPKSWHTKLRSKPKDREELLKLRLLVLNMNKEWKKRELTFKLESLQSKQIEN